MKKYQFSFCLALVAMLFFASCTKSSNSPICIDVEYGVLFDMEDDQSYCFPDGFEINVEELRNEFCCCFCVCVWEGEIVASLKIEEEDFDFHTGYETVDLPSGRTIEINSFELVNECENVNENPNVKNISVTVRK